MLALHRCFCLAMAFDVLHVLETATAVGLTQSLRGHQKEAQGQGQGQEPQNRNLFSIGDYKVYSLDDGSIDDHIAQYMRKAIVTKMIIQPMIVEQLHFVNETVSFADEHLENVQITTDGSVSNIFQVKDSGRQFSTTKDCVIRVLKRDGVVKSATKLILSTGEKISAAPMGNGTYAIYSTNDIDQQQLDLLYGAAYQMPDRNTSFFGGEQNKDGDFDKPPAYNPDDFRQLMEGSTCSEFTVVRVDIRFDSAFCADNGGYQGAVDKIHAIIAEVNDPYNAYPMCTKVKICRTSGHCNSPGIMDEYQQVIANSSDFCSGDNMLLENFRRHIYSQGIRRRDLYPEYECDATHLFFGDGSDPFPYTTTIGCSYGAICNEGSAGVDQVGSRSDNLVAQSAIFAHELGHNFNAPHDPIYGYVMYRSICTSCNRFSPESIATMKEFAARQDPDTCFDTERALVSARSPTKSPTRSPTNPPTGIPTRSPTNPPTGIPTRSPTNPPTDFPSDSTSSSPSIPPSYGPSSTASYSPVRGEIVDPALARFDGPKGKTKTAFRFDNTERNRSKLIETKAKAKVPKIGFASAPAPEPAPAAAAAAPAASAPAAASTTTTTTTTLRINLDVRTQGNDDDNDEDNDDDDVCLSKFLDRSTCDRDSSQLCSWHASLNQCRKRRRQRSDVAFCGDHEDQTTCFERGLICVWVRRRDEDSVDLDSGSCVDPCAGSIGQGCDDRAGGYCTWMPEAGECRVRHELACKDYASRYRCANQGAYCRWELGACYDVSDAPDDADTACGAFKSEYFCVRDRFELCGWDFKRTQCRSRAFMSCGDFRRKTFCTSHGGARCAWNDSLSMCVDR